MIEVTGVTTSIQEGIDAVSAILTALIVAYGLFMGYRMVVRELMGHGTPDLYDRFDGDWDAVVEYEAECEAEFDRSIDYQAEQLADEMTDMDLDDYIALKGYDPIDWEKV